MRAQETIPEEYASPVKKKKPFKLNLAQWPKLKAGQERYFDPKAMGTAIESRLVLKAVEENLHLDLKRRVTLNKEGIEREGLEDMYLSR